MAASSLFPNIVLFFYSIFILQSLSGITNATNHDFSVRIIHRDSPLSPLYNGSITAQDRLQAAARRSISRLSYIHSLTQHNNKSSSTIVPPNDGEYTLNFSRGSTPIQGHAFIDTSSGHIHVQCLQNGTLSNDKFAFQDLMSNFVDVGYLNFTCSSNSSWNFDGAFGLSQGPLSLVSQLGIKNFSYCIVTPNNEGLGSIMNFGSEAVNSGGQTPIVEGDDRFYYVNLNGISVGDRNVPLPDGIFNKTSEGEGGFIIDSGTMYTLLRSEAYDVLVKALGEATNLPKRRGPSNLFELCFEGSSEDLDAAAPDVSFVFDNAEVMLTKQTTYVEAEEGLWCLAMVRSNEKLSILGSTQQQNYFVGYDLDHQVVSFAPVDCSIF